MELDLLKIPFKYQLHNPHEKVQLLDQVPFAMSQFYAWWKSPPFPSQQTHTIILILNLF